jgi:glycosyltransferase involved in cell wall biosynthesis
MKFNIITPTHKRKDKLERAVQSVLAQTYKDWELIIINDSPHDESYKEFASSINDARIHYHVNPKNEGVNKSRNHALDKLSADSKWVLFLDDDDYLAPDTLATFSNLILLDKNTKWYMTNRAYKNGKPVTITPEPDAHFTYAWSYLILKRIKGDATHCIETKLITHIHARFSQYVKQGEEWLFFYQIGLYTKLFYHDHNSTITDGYDGVGGLNFRKRSFSDRFESLVALTYEGMEKKLLLKPSFILYMLLRFLKLCIPKIQFKKTIT